VEPEGSLPHSQVPSTCPYPEPVRSSPYPHIPIPDDPSKYYPPIYVRVSQVNSFPQVSPPKHNTHIFSPTNALHAPLISFLSILPPEQHSVSRTDHYVVSSTALLHIALPIFLKFVHYFAFRIYKSLFHFNFRLNCITQTYGFAHKSVDPKRKISCVKTE
jgi:hypothetical protein